MVPIYVRILLTFALWYLFLRAPFSAIEQNENTIIFWPIGLVALVALALIPSRFWLGEIQVDGIKDVGIAGGIIILMILLIGWTSSKIKDAGYTGRDRFGSNSMLRDLIWIEYHKTETQ